MSRIRKFHNIYNEVKKPEWKPNLLYTNSLLPFMSPKLLSILYPLVADNVDATNK